MCKHTLTHAHVQILGTAHMSGDACAALIGCKSHTQTRRPLCGIGSHTRTNTHTKPASTKCTQTPHPTTPRTTTSIAKKKTCAQLLCHPCPGQCHLGVHRVMQGGAAPFCVLRCSLALTHQHKQARCERNGGCVRGCVLLAGSAAAISRPDNNRQQPLHSSPLGVSLLNSTSCITWSGVAVVWRAGEGGEDRSGGRAWTEGRQGKSHDMQRQTQRHMNALCPVPINDSPQHTCQTHQLFSFSTQLTMPSTVAHAAMLRASPTDCSCTTTQ